MHGTIVFDVNETLLDLSALDPQFTAAFGSLAARKEWFSELLKQAFITTITGSYADFTQIGRSALLVLEKRHRLELSENQRSQILGTMQKLPPHPDVKPGLDRLKAAGWRLVALTNSTQQVAEAQLTYAGLRPYLDHVFSADAARRLKPAPEPYQMVARKLDVSADTLLLTAAHSWDIAGATKVGYKTVLINRPGQLLDSLTSEPNFVAADILDLASQLT